MIDTSTTLFSPGITSVTLKVNLFVSVCEGFIASSSTLTLAVYPLAKDTVIENDPSTLQYSGISTVLFSSLLSPVIFVCI